MVFFEKTRHLSIEHRSVYLFKVYSYLLVLKSPKNSFSMFLTGVRFIFLFQYYHLGTALKRLDNLRKKFNEKRRNVQQHSRFGSGANVVSKSAKDFKEYSFLEWLKSFAQPRKSKCNFLDRTDYLETNGGVKVKKMTLIIIQILEKIKTGRVNVRCLIWMMNKRTFLNRNQLVCQMREKRNLFR